MAGSFDGALQRWETWWERKNNGPLLSIMYPRQEVDYTPVRKPWMSPPLVEKWTSYMHEFLFGQAVEYAWKTGDFAQVDEALEFLAYYAEVTGNAGEGFPFLFANLGAAMMPALITNYTQFKGTTIWVEQEEPWDWDRLLAIDEDARTPYAEAALEGVRRLARRLSGKFVIAPPELGGLLDVLAGMRGTQNLLTDLLLYPDNVKTVLEKLDRIWLKYYREFSEIIDPANHGAYAVTMRYLSSKPNVVGSCDFSAMIAPEMFQEFFIPYLQRDLERFPGRVVYHLDGPGELPHVEHLCAQESLYGVQWVTGAGNPGNLDERWDPLYRQLLDAGKRVFLCGGPRERLPEFFKRFPAREFFVPFTARGEQHAQELLGLRDSF